MIGIQVLYSGVLIGLTLHGCTPSLYRWGAPEAEIFVFKFLLWPGFESRTLQSNGRERYHSTTAPPRVKDLHKVITWRLERDSNPRPSGRKASTLPMRHHVPHVLLCISEATDDTFLVYS